MTSLDAGPAWSAWSSVTPVTATRVAATERYVRVRIPLGIDPGPDGRYADVRVAGTHGDEIPYALDPGRLTQRERSVPVIDTGFVPHGGTQAVLDLGASGEPVDAVTVDVDTAKRPTYFERVAIDASDDRTTWRIVRDDAILYRVAQDAGRGNATLAFPVTRSRWLRVRVLDPGAPFPLTGARTASGSSPEPVMVRLAVSPQASADAATHEQRWVFDAGAPVRPSAVTFADGGALYERAVSVQTSGDAKDWNAAGDGTIAHYAEGGAQTSVAVPETTARYVRVVVRNGNDAPLRSLRPALLARPHEVVFESHGTAYRLLSGNPSAGAPSYDLGARLAHEDWHATPARAGAPARNAGYRDARPLGERFPWLVTGALLAAALVLGVLALRVVKSSPATP